MNRRFWNLFGENYHENCLKWEHHKGNPVIPAGSKPWKKLWTANPHFLPFNGDLLLYYRGHGYIPGREDEGHDRISVAKVADIGADRFIFSDYNDQYAAIDCGSPGEFDEYHALDPGVTVFNDKVWLYYSAIGSGSPDTDSIGAAVSDDGINFIKLGRVFTGRGPDTIVRDGRIWIIYQILDAQGRYCPYLASSDDGLHFTRNDDDIIKGIMTPGGWDSFSITTPRIFNDGEYVYLLYGGSSYLADEPDYFGLARSKDMLEWEQHPGNPIFGCGPKGSPDGGAIWSPALCETPDGFAFLYEGTPGKYSWDLNSQICMSWISG